MSAEVGYRTLDVLGPFRGPCGICGGPDARHRLGDALVEFVGAGDSPTLIAEIYEGYGVTEDVLAQLVATRERNRRRRKYRWAA